MRPAITEPEPVTARRKALFLHLSIGGGHGRAAQAAATALDRRAGDFEVAVLDLHEVATPLFRAIYHDAYLGLVRSLPRLWGALYAAGWLTRGAAVPQWLQPACAGRLASFVEAFRPDVIVATAAPVSALLGHLRETGVTAPRLASLITDYHAHPAHVSPAVDRYLVPGSRVAAGLRKLGATAANIRVTGIPIDEEFRTPLDPARARATLGLRAGAPVVLVMGGALGSGRILRTLVELGRVPGDLEILAVAGRNRRLERRLHRLTQVGRVRVHPFGYTSLIPDLMAAANLFVTKPGGLSTSEALARGLPMVFVDSLHGQESRNRDFFLRGGCAVAVRHRRDLAATVRALLEDEERLSHMSRRATALARPEAAIAVADEIAALADGSELSAARSSAARPR